MPELVLVHGGSHGAWCWERLRPELTRHGYRSHALDLPGHGQDPTPRREVTWASQVEALDRFVRELGAGEVILVGHSLAGGLIPEVAKRRHDVVRQLVFLASIVLEPGECALDTMDPGRRKVLLEMAEASPDRTVFLDWEIARVNFFRGLSDAEAREFYEKLTPQPIDVYVEPARVCVRDLGIPVRYLGFTRDAAITPERAAGFARKAGVSIEMMESAHGAMLTHPLELAEQLIAGLP